VVEALFATVAVAPIRAQDARRPIEDWLRELLQAFARSVFSRKGIGAYRPVPPEPMRDAALGLIDPPVAEQVDPAIDVALAPFFDGCRMALRRPSTAPDLLMAQ